jgi:glutathione S-transferase
MRQCIFVALSYSAWSEKARWALDHHRVDYREVEHVPLLGAPLLRARVRRPISRVTVPALVDDGVVYTDSFDIARRADRIGQGERLFPRGMDDAVATWNRSSEIILEAGRGLLLEKTLRHPGAMQEALPAQIPRTFRPRMIFLAKAGARFLQHKYGASGRDLDAERARIARELASLREVLEGPDGYVLGNFTYADIAMAVALQVVWPVDNRWLPLGEGTRVVWQEPDLAEAFRDLIAWRDRVYDKHR